MKMKKEIIVSSGFQIGQTVYHRSVNVYK